MNTLKYISLVIILLFSTLIQAQKFSETIEEERQFPSQSSENLLVVNNVYGSVIVEGYNGDTVQITGDLEIRGNTKGKLEQGKTEVSMAVVPYNNIIYVYLESPYTNFDIKTGRYGHNENNRWSNYKNRDGYNYTLNITIKVPKTTNVELSTINGGVVEVKNIEANAITASNINGSITLENVSGKTYVNALNQDINISYSKNPTEESTYESLNGDINITVQNGLNADVNFKSLNGNVYTNIDTQVTPSKSKIIKKKGEKGTKYKVDSNTQFSIGKGGVQLNFDLLNGDVTIKE
jgi:hypothetical protein